MISSLTACLFCGSGEFLRTLFGETLRKLRADELHYSIRTRSLVQPQKSSRNTSPYQIHSLKFTLLRELKRTSSVKRLVKFIAKIHFVRHCEILRSKIVAIYNARSAFKSPYFPHPAFYTEHK